MLQGNGKFNNQEDCHWQNKQASFYSTNFDCIVEALDTRQTQSTSSFYTVFFFTFVFFYILTFSCNWNWSLLKPTHNLYNLSIYCWKVVITPCNLSLPNGKRTSLIKFTSTLFWPQNYNLDTNAFRHWRKVISYVCIGPGITWACSCDSEWVFQGGELEKEVIGRQSRE